MENKQPSQPQDKRTGLIHCNIRGRADVFLDLRVVIEGSKKKKKWKEKECLRVRIPVLEKRQKERKDGPK